MTVENWEKGQPLPPASRRHWAEALEDLGSLYRANLRLFVFHGWALTSG